MCCCLRQSRLCRPTSARPVGWSIGGGEPVKLTQASCMQLAILSYFAMLAGVAVMGGFIHWMARTYDANPTLTQCIVFAAYTATPLFIGGLAGLYPHLWLGMLVGTRRSATRPTCSTLACRSSCEHPEDEGFMFSSSVLAVGLVVLVAIIALSVITWGMGIGPVYVR